MCWTCLSRGRLVGMHPRAPTRRHGPPPRSTWACCAAPRRTGPPGWRTSWPLQQSARAGSTTYTCNARVYPSAPRSWRTLRRSTSAREVWARGGRHLASPTRARKGAGSSAVVSQAARRCSSVPPTARGSCQVRCLPTPNQLKAPMYLSSYLTRSAVWRCIAACHPWCACSALSTQSLLHRTKCLSFSATTPLHPIQSGT
mmetsp:Transcript_18609/g.47291  ORF Transcript_18609/g.47291 Transcript_18609/m.47291 type:complete len:200 (-) Transcript_18609:834-1433(-)